MRRFCSTDPGYCWQGRGTVVTGRVEQGIVRTGDEVEILGINTPIKTTVTGVEMFKKQLNEGQAGDNVGLLLRGIKRDDVVRGQVGIQHHSQSYQHPSHPNLQQYTWPMTMQACCCVASTGTMLFAGKPEDRKHL